MSSTTTTFRRPGTEDAYAVSQTLFGRGERVDMQTVAEALGIGRSTLYRWVGDRERLMGHVVVERIGPTWAAAQRDARGRGLDRTLDSVGRFIRGVVDDAALSSFVTREPSLALRVLLDPEGLVARSLSEGVTAAVLADSGRHLTEEDADVLMHLATAQVWASVAGGLEPRVEAIVRVLRKLLDHG